MTGLWWLWYSFVKCSVNVSLALAVLPWRVGRLRVRVVRKARKHALQAKATVAPVMMKFTILLLFAALVGCATKPSSRSAGDYRVPLTNGFIAFVQADGNTLRVLVKHGDDFVTDLMTDGERVQFTQQLNNRPDKTSQEKDSGFGNLVWIATDKGKLTRHYVEIFDGNRQQRLNDRDNDFFFDERVSVGVDQNFKSIPNTTQREQIKLQFVPKEAVKIK